MAKKKTRVQKKVDRFVQEGRVETKFSTEDLILEIYMNQEIANYERNRENYRDPLSKYKEVVIDKIKTSMEKNNIVIPDEVKDMPIEMIAEFTILPSKSGNNLGELALMLNNKIKRTIKPDGDNLLKTLKDILNDLAWTDDKQVYKSTPIKLYGREESTKVTIKYVPNYTPSTGDKIVYQDLLADGVITVEDLEFARQIKKS